MSRNLRRDNDRVLAQPRTPSPSPLTHPYYLAAALRNAGYDVPFARTGTRKVSADAPTTETRKDQEP